MNNTRQPYKLPIHFGNKLGKHEIHSNSLITFIEAYSEIAKQCGITMNIKITPPEEGGWNANLIIVASFIGINLISSLLTGKSADYWGEIGHQKIIEEVNNFIVAKADKVHDEPTEELKECIKQKNKIYEQFLSDECIENFDLDKHPSIPRNNFQLYIKKLEDDENVYLGKTDIVVFSPDWKGNRSWQGNIVILQDKKAKSFDFNKNLTGKFWEKIELDALKLHTQDTMSVQLIEKPTKRIQYQVIRVLTYNNVSIDDELSENNIRKLAILDNKSTGKNQQQGELNYQWNNNDK